MSLKKFLVNARTKILEFKKKHNLLVEKVSEIPNVEEATSGTIENVLGLDSNGNLVKGNISSGTKIYKYTGYVSDTQFYPSNALYYEVISSANIPELTGTKELTIELFDKIVELSNNVICNQRVLISDTEFTYGTLSTERIMGVQNIVDSKVVISNGNFNITKVAKARDAVSGKYLYSASIREL